MSQVRPRDSRWSLDARERFLTTGSPPAGVPDDIATSWRRSALSGVRPDEFDLPYEPDFDDDSRLLRAAKPVVDRLVEQLGLAAMSVILTDRRARIIRRWADPGLQSQLDRVLAAPGFVYSEELAGTNGLGTALEHGKPAVVMGGEHFCDRLLGMTCVGVPLLNPVSGRLEGVLDLTCREQESSPLMLPLALRTADAIAAALLDEASATQRRLLDEFTRVRRTSRQAIVAVSNDLVITNRQAARFLQPADQPMLLEQAARALAADGGIDDLVLTSGARGPAACQAVMEDGRLVGAVVVISPRAAGEPPASGASSAAPAVAGLAGRNAAWRACVAESDRAVASGVPLLIFGEEGAGKAALALSLLRRGPRPPVGADAAEADRDGERLWLARVAASGQANDAPLLVRHVDLLGAPSRASLARLLDKRAPGQPVVMTSALPAEELGPLGARFACAVEAPPLRQRREDIAAVAAALGEAAGAAWPVRLEPLTLQALMAHDWPGNVRELESLVRALCVRGTAAPVALAELPMRYRRPARARSLSRLEQAELDAIAAEMEASGGNKQLAARRLGISRSTLYRKLAQYRLEPDLRGGPTDIGA